MPRAFPESSIDQGFSPSRIRVVVGGPTVASGFAPNVSAVAADPGSRLCAPPGFSRLGPHFESLIDRA